MRRFPWIPIAILLAPLAALAQVPQSNPSTDAKKPPAPGDWSRVLALAQGDEITVKTARMGNLRCDFTGATATELYCRLRRPAVAPFIQTQEYSFPRADVVKVRHRHFRRNFKATVVASAGVGCALGWIGGGGPAGCIAAGFGVAMVGGVAGMMGWYWLPGNVVYENREAARKRVPARSKINPLTAPQPALAQAQPIAIAR